jgi:hypothetical protein
MLLAAALDERNGSNTTAYTMAKFGMNMCVLVWVD